MDIPQFMYSPVDGHLGCFKLWSVMIKALMHIQVKVFFL